MKSIISIFLFLTVLVSSKLEMVIEFIRHGARGPNDADWNPEKWGDGSEIHQLTEVGMRQTYVLGREMRKKYIEKENFLSRKYNNRELYVRSTASNRALQSASSHMYGLYPLGTGLMIDQNYPLNIAVPPYENLTVNIQDIGYDALPKKFQPIEIHSIDKEKDMLLNYFNICPTSKILSNIQVKSQLYENFNQEFSQTFSKLKMIFNETNPSPWNISKVSRVATNIYADIYKNNPLPTGLTKELWDNMTFIKDLERQYVDVGSPQQRKFMGTPLFKEILKYFNEKINNPNFELKFVFYSGHYLTLTPLMSGMNLTSWECLFDKFHGKVQNSLNCEKGYPIYASQILIELHSLLESNGSKHYYVKVIYNGKNMKLCEKDKFECEYFDFQNRIIENIILDEFDKICHDESFLSNKDPSNKLTKLEPKIVSPFLEKFSKFLYDVDNGMKSSLFY